MRKILSFLLVFMILLLVGCDLNNKNSSELTSSAGSFQTSDEAVQKALDYAKQYFEKFYSEKSSAYTFKIFEKEREIEKVKLTVFEVTQNSSVKCLIAANENSVVYIDESGKGNSFKSITRIVSQSHYDEDEQNEMYEIAEYCIEQFCGLDPKKCIVTLKDDCYIIDSHATYLYQVFDGDKSVCLLAVNYEVCFVDYSSTGNEFKALS